jgi:hypothetical protein
VGRTGFPGAVDASEIGGDKAKEGLATDTFEASGDNLRFRGVYVVTMQSGDKAFMPYQGTGTTKEGKPSGEEWSCDIEGEYELAK